MSATLSCQDFRQFVDCYLDAEFDDRDRARFDAHVAACTCCRAIVDHHVAFRRALRPHLRTACGTLPPEARARLRRAISQVQEPSSFTVWARRLALPVPVMAAGVLLLVMPTAGFTGFVVKEAVEQHDQSMPVEVPSAHEEELEAWFRDKLPFELAAPRFRDERLQLLGGRLTRLPAPDGEHAQRKAAWLVYGLGRHKVSVLVFDAADVEVPDAPTALEENGLSVALYRHGGMGYAITSDLAQSDMMRLVSSSF